MKFLCLAYYDTGKFAALPPEELQALVSQCPAHDASLRASGALRLQASLGDPAATRTLRPGSGKPSITDGPFVETKEQVGGYYLIEARDLNEAILVAARIPGAARGCVEVRPIAQDQQTQRILAAGEGG
jgi:hypothetical protein